MQVQGPYYSQRQGRTSMFALPIVGRFLPERKNLPSCSSNQSLAISPCFGIKVELLSLISRLSRHRGCPFISKGSTEGVRAGTSGRDHRLPIQIVGQPIQIVGQLPSLSIFGALPSFQPFSNPPDTNAFILWRRITPPTILWIHPELLDSLAP